MAIRRAPLAAAAVSVGLTGAVALLPLRSIRFAYESETIHVALETTAALVAGAAAFLLAGRAAERARRADVLLAAGLAAFALTNLAFGVVPELVDSRTPAWADWAGLVGRLVGDDLLVAAAFAGAATVTRPDRTLRAALTAVAASLALVGLGAFALRGALPETLIPGLASAGSYQPLFAGHRGVIAIQLASAVLLAAAAVGFARGRAWRASALGSWLATAAVLGAAARLNYALYPSLYSEWVYTGDLFRLAFYVVLLLALAWLVREYWSRLASVAVLEERRRLARDLHDGLAQELAYLVRQAPELTPDEVRATATHALDEARQAIAALARPSDEPLQTAIAAAAEDAARREGARVALQLDERIAAVDGDAREALVRVAREAVSNAARHGDAGEVTLALDDAPLRLVVADAGCGFDPAAVRGGHGITSMRERIEALGGTFSISSSPGAGTRVEAALP
jgi:signal transduction histidine kinase